jgi:hypothetical protein
MQTLSLPTTAAFMLAHLVFTASRSTRRETVPKLNLRPFRTLECADGMTKTPVD